MKIIIRNMNGTRNNTNQTFDQHFSFFQVLSYHINLGPGATSSNDYESCKQAENGNSIDLILDTNKTFVNLLFEGEILKETKDFLADLKSPKITIHKPNKHNKNLIDICFTTVAFMN